jgi:hypothetical protein
MTVSVEFRPGPVFQRLSLPSQWDQLPPSHLSRTNCLAAVW